jgi:membrane protein YdbS with pleckstrin-like domain
MIVLRLLDWRNDYFVITNKHISHREFDLRSFRTQLNKVPISMVQSVAVEQPSLTANLFDIGSVRITTASNVGTIVFDGIDDPGEVETVLNDLRLRVQALDAAVAQSTMRQSVNEHFQLGAEIQAIPDEDDMFADEDLLVLTPSPGIWRPFSRMFDWRLEDGSVITYRRNYLIVLWEIIPPAFVFLLLIVAATAAVTYFNISGSIFYSALFILILFDLFWLLWRYEDWRNDIFQLTDRDVIDIDRRPFAFGESRKQAPLRNIQNVRAERPGFFATIFDYGNVHIETAGAESDIVFDRVPHPSQVLSDIFHRLEEYREGQRRKDGESRREEYTVLLDVYQQELERGRIPRRTPPD